MVLSHLCSGNDWEKIFAAWFEFEDSVIPFRTKRELKDFKENLTKDEESEMERFDVSWENMHWRRKTLRDKCNGDVNKFRQEYPSDPDECFLLSSRPRFNIHIVEEMLKTASGQTCKLGTMSGQGDSASFTPDSSGNWKMYEEPEYDSQYVMSVDTCTGEDQQIQGLAADPDWHSAQIWKRGFEDWHGVWHVPRLVAVHHSRLDIGVLAEEIRLAAQFYGGAFIIPEVNNSGLALVKYLMDAGAHVYQRRKVIDSTGMVEKAFGWSTDKITRKTIIDHLATEIVEGNIDVPDPDVVREFKTFVVNSRGKPEAAPGHHDDHVLAAALAVYNIDSATKFRMPKKKKLSNRMLRKNPRLLCPDGFMRVPLNAYLKNKRVRVMR